MSLGNGVENSLGITELGRIIKATKGQIQGVLKILCQSDIIKYIRIDIDERFNRKSTI